MFYILFIFLDMIILLYSYFRLRKLFIFLDLDLNQKKCRILNFGLSMFILSLCIHIRSIMTLTIIHIVVISIFLDCLSFLLKKLNIQWKIWDMIYGYILLPVVISVCLIIYGIGNMSTIRNTKYQIDTNKKIGQYHIVMLTDIHYGTIQDSSLLKEKIIEINQQNPDIIILGGDIVEEETSKEKMQECFALLGKLKAKYGIYYVYGNHDRQPYIMTPTYTSEELENTIVDCGIHTLKDEYVEINQDLILAGREDAAWGNTSNRQSSQEILEGVDRNKYIIMVDHQPIEAKENDEQGVDLMLSGHTHAGQIWPIGVVTTLRGEYNYGRFVKGNCKVIVSSGFTGWGYPVRTEGYCEYVSLYIS